MKLAIMQPYFFPYLGYLSLIVNSDRFVFLDEVQYIRHGWIERNRILKPYSGWQYISVPLIKHSRDTIIKEIRIRTNEDWQGRILRQLEHYRRFAPHYQAVITLLKKILNVNYDSITDLNVHILEEIFSYLGFTFKYNIFSRMQLSIDDIQEAGDWALNISKALNASEYINPVGGKELFDKLKFDDQQIKLSFLKLNNVCYRQGYRNFEPNLSILDILMFNSVEDVRKLLFQFEIL